MNYNKRILPIIIVVGAIYLAPLNVEACENNLTAGITDSLEEYNDQLTYLRNTDTYEFYKLYRDTIMQLTDSPESIYDYYSNEEILLFQKLVEAEATSGDFYNKCNVASVILNRIESEDFPDKLTDVIMQKKPKIQFSPIADKRINKVEITQSTVDAIEYAFMFKDTTKGALWFDNAKDSWSANNREYIFTDNIGHSFYK